MPNVLSSTFWWKHLPDRLGEPLHLNLIALLAKAFGGFRSKVDFDLVIQRPHAFGILHAADVAAGFGIKRIAALEFGVAAGRGLMNMSGIARRASAATGSISKSSASIPALACRPPSTIAITRRSTRPAITRRSIKRHL